MNYDLYLSFLSDAFAMRAIFLLAFFSLLFLHLNACYSHWMGEERQKKHNNNKITLTTHFFCIGKQHIFHFIAMIYNLLSYLFTTSFIIISRILFNFHVLFFSRNHLENPSFSSHLFRFLLVPVNMENLINVLALFGFRFK